MSEIYITAYPLNRVGGVAIAANKTAAVAGNNYHIPNDGNVRLYITSSAGGTGTVVTPNTVDGNAIADVTLTLAAGILYLFGPWPVNVYGTDFVMTVSANTDILAFRG